MSKVTSGIKSHWTAKVRRNVRRLAKVGEFGSDDGDFARVGLITAAARWESHGVNKQSGRANVEKNADNSCGSEELIAFDSIFGYKRRTSRLMIRGKKLARYRFLLRRGCFTAFNVPASPSRELPLDCTEALSPSCVGDEESDERSISPSESSWLSSEGDEGSL